MDTEGKEKGERKEEAVKEIESDEELEMCEA